MPHDKNGLELNPGDTVAVEFVVKTVSPSDKFCNATLETVEPMYPGDHKTVLTVNTKQTIKVVPPAMAAAMPVAAFGPLDFLSKLKDLKNLLGPVYYAELKEIALAALSQDWRQVYNRLIDLMQKYGDEKLFGKVLMTAVPVACTEAELDEAFGQLENATAEIPLTTTAAENAKLSPEAWFAIIGSVIEFIKLLRGLKK